MAALGLAYDQAQYRQVATLSGGEQKRLVLEALLRGPDEVLLLDEPDNYLDVPGKRWLEEQINQTRKSVLFVSHDRELLARAAAKIVTIEPAPGGADAWVHGGGFGSYHAARVDRMARFEELKRRWDEKHAQLKKLVVSLQQAASISHELASRYSAACCSASTAPTRRISEVAVGEDADDVGAAADLAVESFLGVVRPDLAPDLFRERGEGEDVGAGASRCSATAGSFSARASSDSVELGVHGLGVGLVIDRVQHRLHPAPLGLRGRRHQVRRVVGAAALPGRAGQRGADRLDQAAVRVGGDQLDAGQAAGGQVAEERQPAGAVLSAR